MRYRVVTSFIRFLVFCVPAFVFFPYWDHFIYPFNSKYSDLLITHYPNIVYIRQSLEQIGRVPLWSNMIMSGYPLSADPLSGLFYPPGWLLFILPLPQGFNILFMAHLIFSGIGMYLFLRAEGLCEFCSLLGALSFELMPKTFGHIGEGHVTLVYAVSWTPWLLLFEKIRRALYLPWRQVSCGLVLGMIILADIRWAFYAALLWLCYGFWQAQKTEEQSGNLLTRLRLLGITTGKWINQVLPQFFIAILTGAPLLFPLMEFTPLSTRSLLSSADNLFLSLPPSYLFGLVIPDIAGFAEWLLYPGVFSLLSLLIIVNGKHIKQNTFWLIVAFSALLFSLGDFFPILKAISTLPGFDLLRVPARALFLLGFAFSVLSARGFFTLEEGLSKSDLQRLRLILTAFVLFIGLLTIGVNFLVRETTIKVKFLWSAVGIILYATLIFFRTNEVLGRRLFRVAIVPLLVLDLCGVGFSQLRFVEARQVLQQKSDLTSFLTSLGNAHYRVYSPSYSVPQHIVAQHKLELADGVNPMQLIAYVHFMEQATGIPVAGYSVTIPPFASGDPDADNAGYCPNLTDLGILNVRYIVSEFDLGACRLLLLGKFGNSRVYLNNIYLPRIWVQDEKANIGERMISQPVIRKYTPDDITVDASGPGLLVLSEITYPGWRVNVDGQRAQLIEPLGFLRGVQLSEGSHHVRFYFVPMSFYVGWIIFFITILFILITRLYVLFIARIRGR